MPSEKRTAVEGDLDFGGFAVTGLPAPAVPSAATPKSYVDAADAALTASIATKASTVYVDAADAALTAAIAAAVAAVDLSTRLAKAANLSDLPSVATAKTNLGLAPVASSGSAADLGTGTLPAARLPALQTAVSHNFLTAIGAGGAVSVAQPVAADLSDATAAGLALVTAADAAAQRTALALVPGTDVQAHDAELDAIAGLTSAANKLPYFSGAGTAAVTDFTAAGRALIDDADAAAQRTTLGLAPVAASGSASDLGTGTLPAARLPALQAAVAHQFVTAIGAAGSVTVAQPDAADVTGLAPVATSGSAADLSAGTLPVARLPAHTGDVTKPAGSAATTLANVPNDVPMAGDLLATVVAAPATPAAGKGRIYVDSTSKNLSIKDDAGIVKHAVRTKAAVATQFLTAIADDGTVTGAQPVAADVSGLGTMATQAASAVAITGGSITGMSAPTAPSDVATKAYVDAATPTGALLAANNLSDLASAATARTNLGLAAVAASGSAADLSAGTLPAARLPAHTGDVTTPAGSVATTLANIPSDVPMAGDLLATAIAAPSTPAAGKGRVYVDSTSKALAVKTDAGAVSHTVKTKAAVATQFLTAIADDGTVTAAQPAFTDISGTLAVASVTGLAPVATSGSAADLSTGTLPAARLPAHTGDVTTPAGSAATTLANIPTATPMAGTLLAAAIAAPATPAANKGAIYLDSTEKNLWVKDEFGTLKHMVQSKAAVATQFLTAVNDSGVINAGQPAFTDLSGSATAAQLPALAGDVTKAAGNNNTVNVNAPDGFIHAGKVITTAIAAPATPAAGKASFYVDSTSKNHASKDDAGIVNHGIRTKAAVATQFLTSIADDGSSVLAQPAFTDISGTLGIAAGGTGATTAIAAKDALTTKSTDIASATTTNLAAATGEYANITGTTTITGFGTVTAGALRVLQFNGALTLTYNATSMILPGGGDILTVAGDVGSFRSLGSGNWKCIQYTRAAAPAGSLGSGELDYFPNTTSVDDINPTGMSAATYVRVSNNNNQLFIGGIAGGTPGRILYFRNTNSLANANSFVEFTIEATSSSAVNRIKSSASRVRIYKGQTIGFFYSGTDGRWEQFTSPVDTGATLYAICFSDQTGGFFDPYASGYVGGKWNINLGGNTGGLDLPGLQCSKTFMAKLGASVASANSLILPHTGNAFHITGTTTIKEINSIESNGNPWQAGARVSLIFDSVCSVLDGFGDSGSDTPYFSIRTKSASDIEMAVNGVLELLFDGSHWYEV